MQASLAAKKDKNNALLASGGKDKESHESGGDSAKNEKNEQVVTKGMSTPNAPAPSGLKG